MEKTLVFILHKENTYLTYYNYLKQTVNYSQTELIKFSFSDDLFKHYCKLQL